VRIEHVRGVRELARARVGLVIDHSLIKEVAARFECCGMLADAPSSDERVYYHRQINKTALTRDGAALRFIEVLDALKAVIGDRKLPLYWRTQPTTEEIRSFLDDTVIWKVHARIALICSSLEEQGRLAEVPL